MHRVVIIDDDRAMRLVARSTAEEAGCVIVGEAATAAEGLALVARRRPTLVVMDYRLPDHDGIWATAKIGAELPAARIVAWTSSEELAVADAFRRAGASDVVPKRDLDQLRAIFERPAADGPQR